MGLRKVQPQSQQYNITDAVSQFVSTMEELRDELQEWYDNLPESFQNGEKGERLQEAAGYLEDASTACEEPSFGVDDEPEFSFTPSTKKRMSRSDRRSEAVSLLEGAIDRAREFAQELRDAVEQKKDAGEFNNADGSLDEDAYTAAVEKADGAATEIEAWADEAESAKDTAENVEFPGMYS